MNVSPKTSSVKADLHASTHKYARSNGVPLIISEACKNYSAYSLRPVEYLLASAHMRQALRGRAGSPDEGTLGAKVLLAVSKHVSWRTDYE